MQRRTARGIAQASEVALPLFSGWIERRRGLLVGVRRDVSVIFQGGAGGTLHYWIR